MTRLFAALGVDFGQWRALMRAYTLVDWSVLLGAYGPEASRRAAWELLMMVVACGLMSSFVAVVIWLSRDTLLAATLMTVSIAGVGAGFALYQTTTLVRPADHGIVGFRPVSSRTYLAARVTGIAVHGAMTAALVSYVPALAFLTRRGGSVPLALAALASAGLATLTTMLATVALHGWAVRLLAAARLARFIGYLNHLAGLGMVIVVLVAIGQFAEGLEGGESWLRDFTIPRTGWTLLFPAIWFAVFVEMARGSFGTFEIAGALLAGVAVVLAGAAVLGQLAAGYGSTVTEIILESAPRVTKPGRAWAFLRNEARVVAFIVGSHLRADLTFQSSFAMAIIMVGALFLVVPMADRPVDPFLDSSTLGTGFLFIAAFLSTSCYQMLLTSQSHQASWIFYATPSDHVRLITAARDAVALAVLGPAVAAMVLLFVYFYGHVGHALLHAAPVAVLGYIALQLKAAFPPRLLMSVPLVQKGRGLTFDLSMLVFMLLAIPVQLLFAFYGYRNAGTAAAGVLGLLMASVVIGRWTRARLDARVRALTFTA